MTINTLRYQKEHIKTLSKYLFIIKLNKSFRIVNISYSIVFRIFEQVEFPLNHNIYYNIRSRTVSIEQNEFVKLVVVLKKTGFIFKCRIEKKFDTETDIVINRQL